jgi:ABC-type oligopeptide transport system substrate-binding subunit/class 3 adenylate cyclase
MAVVAGERRIVTVLFADIVGSTAISEQLGPERFSLLMNEVLRVMSAQVERFEGTVVQFIGDELYALFGAPRSHEDDSERAVRAGLAIQRALSQYADEVRAAYGVELAVRIAINTGPVVIRPEDEDPYNAMGDTVNVAARIQKLVDGGEIVVGRSTMLQVEGSFELERLGSQELRGITEPVETFRVLGVLDDQTDEDLTALVGRDFELSVLDHAMESLVDGRGAIVSILGEPGIGKSRLVAEVRRRHHERIRFVEGRAVSYAQTFPYWPARDLLREWLGLGATAPEARVRLELKAELAHLFGAEADGVYPFLASVLGLTLEPEAVERLNELSREGVRRETFEVFNELVCRIAGEGSVCLVFEDLHWADDATLDLLEALLPVTEEAAVGIILCYRSEREHGSWRLGERARQRHPHRYREIELRPLPDDASRSLATAVAGAELPDSVAELLAIRAGGNPFFLEEALHDLIERGALRRVDGHFELAVERQELTIPTLVQGALQARLDRLDAPAREVISLAAVIGRTFGLPLLERLVPYDELIPALSELQRLDLVVERRRRPTPEYSFRHGLVQEVAYASLLDAKRRKLHRRVGEALEALYPDSREEVYALLARHFTEADDAEKAAEYLLRAGDAARALFADQEALEHYGRAREFLARLGDDRRARDTLFKMALAHHLSFDFERAEDAYDEAFCCRAPPSPRPQRTERLETGVHFNWDSFDLVPGYAYATEEMALLEHLFRGLLAVDREQNVLPAMADNFRVSSDGLTYLFRIREGMRWSDGVPVTANDFAYGWTQMREEGAVTAFLLEDVAAAEALDDRTLEIRVEEPRSYFPFILASPWSFPWPRHACEKHGEDWSKPENIVCNGPFVVAELSREHALLAPNPHWLGPHGNVREVHVTLAPTHDELIDGWREGRFDLLEAFDASVADCADTLTTTVSKFGTHFLAYDRTSEPFSNELVRKAFSLALDRARLLAPTTFTRPATRGGMLPPAMPGHAHRIGLDHDLERARSLLAQAGYQDGEGLPELELQIPSWFDPAPFVEQWALLGARVRAVPAQKHHWVESSAKSGALRVTGWWADYPDPDGFFRGLLRYEASLRDDEEVCELAREARSLRDPRARMRLYNELDRLIVSERALLLPIAYGRTMLVRRPWVENVWANSMSGAHFDEVTIARHATRSP